MPYECGMRLGSVWQSKIDSRCRPIELGIPISFIPGRAMAQVLSALERGVRQEPGGPLHSCLEVLPVGKLLPGVTK